MRTGGGRRSAGVDPVGVVEEARDVDGETPLHRLLVDEVPEGQVEHSQPERGEDHGTVVRDVERSGQYVVEGPVQKSAVPGALFGQMDRGVGLQYVLDVVDDVDATENDGRIQVPQRHVEDRRMVLEPRGIAEVGLPRRCGEHHEIGAPDELLRRVVDGDFGVDRAELGGARLGVRTLQVVHADPGELQLRRREVFVDVAGYQADADESDPQRLAGADQAAGRDGGGGRCPCGADDGALQAGEGVPGGGVVEDEDGGGARNARVQVAGEAGDPFEPADRFLAAQGGGERDDAVPWAVGEAEEVGGWVGRSP